MSEKRTETDKLLNVPGTVEIGDRQISVASLSLREERALFFELADIVAAESDPFQRIAPVLARLEKEKKILERNVLLDVAARAVVNGERPSSHVVLQARRTSPAVLVRELYRRAKKFHPALREEELTAVIMSTNVGELCDALDAALGAEKDDPKASP